MLITSRQKHQIEPLILNVHVNDNAIDQVREHRVLGVIIDDELKWQLHIEKMTHKLARSLFLLKKTYTLHRYRRTHDVFSCPLSLPH